MRPLCSLCLRGWDRKDFTTADTEQHGDLHRETYLSPENLSMKTFRSYFSYLLLSALLVLAFSLTGGSLAQRQTPAGPTLATREDAYRANNIGVALLEQFKHKEAAEAFKNALKIDPKLNLAHINLSIALFNVPDLPAAQREAQNATAARA